MRAQAALFAVIAVVTAGYPFIVYSGLTAFGPAALSLVLFALLLARVVMRGDYHQPEQYAQLLVVGSLCLLAAWRDSELILRYYPVAMSLGFAGFFAISLRAKETLIERFASVFVSDIQAHQRQYMRGLTKIWVGLLLFNAMVASYTACCLSLAHWTLYNGVIAYVMFGLFSMAELVNRHFYKKRYSRRQQNHPSDSA